MNVKRQKVFDNFGDITGTKGNVSNNGIWKVKNITAVPTAKKDVNGMLVSNPDLLKKLHLDTYHHRLRNRPIRPDLKEDLFQLRLKLSNLRKSKPWTGKNLDNGIPCCHT